jgi:S-adenosylmethionine:tRNA ribosyltransferase-isomerase
MKLSLFDYHLPENLIAQHPEQKRDHSRLLIVDQHNNSLKDEHFFNIIHYLNDNDVVVINNTKVIPARIFGIKHSTQAHIEILLLDEQKSNRYHALVRPAKRVNVGDEIIIKSDFKLICVEVLEDGMRTFDLVYEGILLEHLEEVGQMPLPPYIKALNEKERYQTVYAKYAGSSAAPTAGLHFTHDLMTTLKERGVTFIELTLHVGLGTFQSVKTDNIEDHHMHEETYVISEATAHALNEAKRLKKRLIAVGTTSLRALESNYDGAFHAGTFKTNIFIYPPYQIKSIDGLITNFHLPKSTLLMLVSAFSSLQLMKKAYEHAVLNEYRFFSFGDAMFIAHHDEKVAT